MFDSPKLKEFADDNPNLIKVAESSQKKKKNVGKGEIARNEQCFLFSTAFSKDLFCRHVKTGACLRKG